MDDLKLIKKHYGEKMMHLCRDLFPTLLETPGLLYETLTSKYYPSRFLYDDIIENSFQYDFKNIIFNAAYVEEEKTQSTFKTPFELMEKAGYTLYECKTEADIQSFRHYYKRRDGRTIYKYTPGTTPLHYDGEELCTFSGGRLQRDYVFFAVRNGADEIKREDFPYPQRQDEYGTSVISIQFTRGANNTLSIKNRYNHTVENPDSTFGNNLDNIAPGLTASFEKHYGFNINSQGSSNELPGYVLATDGKYYKYNFENDNIYYCSDNIVISDFEVKAFDKSRYLVMDNYIIDFQEKTIKQFKQYYESLYLPRTRAFEEAFIDDKGNTTITKIEVLVDKETNNKKIIIDTLEEDLIKKIKIPNKGIVIELNPTNSIKGYRNDYVSEIGNEFLDISQHIEYLDLPNVENIGEFFLYHNKTLNRINISRCKKIDIAFLYENRNMESIDLPNVENIRTSFMYHNKSIKNINFPNCYVIADYFLNNNSKIEEINLPKCRGIGNSFLYSAYNLKKINLPECIAIGSEFLKGNVSLELIDLPNVESIGAEFMKESNTLKLINLNNCKSIGSSFLLKNNVIESIDLPNVIDIGASFLEKNKVLKFINMPKCKSIGKDFLSNNIELRKIDLPSILTIDNYFLFKNRVLKSINIPNCRKIGARFLEHNQELDRIDLSSVENIDGFPLTYMISEIFPNNRKIKKIINKGADPSEKGEGSRKR